VKMISRWGVPVLVAVALLVPAAASAQVTGPVARVPSDFQPASASFLSISWGVVLGSVGCTKTPCRALLAGTADGGAHWHFLKVPDVSLVNPAGTDVGARVSAVVFASRRDGWLYGPGLWATHDGGAHWHRLSVGGAVVSMAASAGTAYAIIRPHHYLSRGGRAKLFRSPAGKNAWVRLGTMTGNPAAILAVSRKAAWFGASVAGTPTNLWATADGMHWHKYRFRCPKAYFVGLGGIAPSSRSHVMFLCIGSGFAGGAGKAVLRSSDGGKTEHLVGPAPSEGDVVGFAAPPGRPAVITLAAVSGASWLDTSRNGGKTWTVTRVGGSEPLNSLAYVSRTVGWVVLGTPGPNGSHGLLRTTDTGRIWHRVRF
jgi:hypothetical protein